MKIIFICKYNAFRSRVAEEYFKKVNKNKKIKVISRGIIIGGNSDREQRKIAEKILRVNIGKRKPIPLRLQDLIESDKIIVVANDVPKIIFNYQLTSLRNKLEIWDIKDEQKKNKTNINGIVLRIMKKVDDLNRKLEKTK